MAKKLSDTVQEVMKEETVGDRLEFCIRMAFYWDVLTDAEYQSAKQRLRKMWKKERAADPTR